MKSMTFSITRLPILLLLLTVLAGCQSTKDFFGMDGEPNLPETETLPVEELYALGKKELDEGDYDKAEKVFTRLVARFPYGAISEQAQLDLAFAQFKLAKYEEASSTVSRFIKMYPVSAQIDYAYYLKALINFDRENRWLAKIARLNMSARDLGAAQQSYNDFNEVIRRFPTSKYAPEARDRMIYLRNRLALHDLDVGIFYYNREAYVSAAGRAKYLLETYPQSSVENDAVALLAAAYSAMGQDSLAQDSRRILEANDPQHPYLTGKWPKQRSQFSALVPFSGEY
jgi:outer membrane protein assembly factor BamD